MSDLPPPTPEPVAPAAAAAAAGRAGGRALRIALAVSVTLNLVVAGLVAGAVLRGPPGGDGPHEREMTFGPFSDAMRPDDRKALRKEILKRAPDLRGMRDQMRDDVQKVLVVLRAEPFDPAALTALLDAQQARLTGQLDVGTAALRDFLVALPEDERHAFADRLEARLKHKAGEGDRPPG